MQKPPFYLKTLYVRIKTVSRGSERDTRKGTRQTQPGCVRSSTQRRAGARSAGDCKFAHGTVNLRVRSGLHRGPKLAGTPAKRRDGLMPLRRFTVPPGNLQSRGKRRATRRGRDGANQAASDALRCLIGTVRGAPRWTVNLSPKQTVKAPVWDCKHKIRSRIPR